MTATLLSRTGRITREELQCIPVPQTTRTHQPIPHHEIVRTLVETLGFRHIGIVRDEYAVSQDGMRMFGVLDLEIGMQGCRFSIGIRNANDKSMRLALTVGYRVLVCDNMAFHGDFTPVLAKHSKSFSLIDAISIGVDRMHRNFEPMQKQVEVWREGQISDVTAKLLIYQAFVESKLDVAVTVYTLRFAREVYGKSEHHRSEKPNTQLSGKSGHVERKSSSSETKARKESLCGRVVEENTETSRPQLRNSKPSQSKFDDDEKPETRKTFATPEDELRAIYSGKTGQAISRDLLNRLSDTCELRGVPISRFVEELRPHVPNLWKNPGGFLTDFARKFKSKVSGPATPQPAKVDQIVKESQRCAKCRGMGRADGGYCACQMGTDLKRVEGWATAQPVSPAPATSGQGKLANEGRLPNGLGSSTEIQSTIPRLRDSAKDPQNDHRADEET